MADPASYDNPDRNFDQTLLALKKGTQLIKYSRKGKPKLCTFRLSPDETTLLWYSRKAERNLKLSSVTRIIPGQRTPVFKRYLRPEKDYLSFSLIYNKGERSLDLICKDQAETEIWLGGLKSLTSTGPARNRHTKSEVYDLHGSVESQDNRPFVATVETLSSISRARLSIDSTSSSNFITPSSSHVGYEGTANMQVRTSGADGFRISVSSTPSCSSQGSGHDDIESLGDVYLWGEVWLDGVASDSNGNPIPSKNDVPTPQPLETNVVLDVHQLSCGVRHVALVTRQGEVFTWGEESGGRLGHGIESDFSRPKLVEFLAVTNVDSVACGEFHTCALSTSGDLYTWGDGTHSAGLLGHGNDVSHWIPKRVSGFLEGHQVLSIACGTWHSALTTSSGKLFTFGDGTFGALGHGDRSSTPYPREVESLYGLKAVTVSCGVWHTAAIIEVTNHLGGSNVLSRKLFTWGDGDKNRLGHGNKETYFLPTCVSSLIDYNMHQIACGHNITVALTNTGHVFTMGSNSYGQLGNPNSDGKLPCLVQDKLVGEFVEQISCGEHHVAALTSRSELFTWGRGLNGRLGHGDSEDRNLPTLVEALRDRHVRNIVCGSNYTTCICIHKWVSGADQSLCTGCRQAFGFTRKRHNCYHCGLVHCHACSSKKALKAALAPTPGKPHRVCDSCFLKLKKMAEASNMSSSTFNRKASNRRRSVDFSLRPDRGDVMRGPSRVLLSPTVEPVKYHEIKSFAAKTDYSIVRTSQVPSLLQLKDIAFPSSLSALQFALKPVITSVPQPQTPPAAVPPPHTPPVQSNSRPASPYRRPSPPRSAAPVFSRGVIDTLKKSNDLLTQEISKLHGQVKVLKQKSEVQETEISNLKKIASEATSLAADRSDKCIRAMQAATTITDQFKEITEKLPPEIPERESFEAIRDQLESFLDAIRVQEHEDNPNSPHEGMQEHENQSDRASSSANGSNNKEDHVTEEDHHNMDASEVDTNGSHEQHTDQSNTEHEPSTQHRPRSEGRREVIEQFEPGVYVTVIQLSNGTKIFKGVRFSKRKFSEAQAAVWLKENKDRLLKKYRPAKVSSSSSSESVSAQAETEDSNQTIPENTLPETSS